MLKLACAYLTNTAVPSQPTTTCHIPAEVHELPINAQSRAAILCSIPSPQEAGRTPLTAALSDHGLLTLPPPEQRALPGARMVGYE
jgi:hypothetical protein